MKKTTLLLLSLCAMLFAALREGGRQDNGASAAKGIAFLLPQATSDLSTLDARDSQNNAITSPSAAQELDSLFRENLVALVVFAAPHNMAAMLAWIDSISHLINKAILARLSTAFEAIMEAIFPSNRRFVHNVDKLWITFSVGVLAGCFMLAAFSLQRTPRQLYLRC